MDELIPFITLNLCSSRVCSLAVKLRAERGSHFSLQQ